MCFVTDPAIYPGGRSRTTTDPADLHNRRSTLTRLDLELEAVKQDARSDVKSTSQSKDVVQRNVPFSSFRITDVSGMKTRYFGEFFL